MDSTTLAHHTQLTDWCVQRGLQQDRAVKALLPHHHPDSPLTLDKLQSLHQWCSQVNRLLFKAPSKDSPVLFRRFKYSDSMFPPNRSTTPCPSRRPQTCPSQRNKVSTVVLNRQATVKPTRKTYTNGAVTKKKNSSKMIDAKDGTVSTNHKVVQIQVLPDQAHKSSNGWTTNRQLRFPAYPSQSSLSRSPRKRLFGQSSSKEGSEEKSSSDASISIINISENQEIPTIDDLSDEPRERNGSVSASRERNGSVSAHRERNESVSAHREHNGSVSAHTEHNGSVSAHTEHYRSMPTHRGLNGSMSANTNKWSTTGAKSTKSEGGDEDETMRQGEVKEPPHPNRSVLMDRSASNDMLKVLTVDDCRMMLRYRPVRVVNTHHSMLLPSSTSLHLYHYGNNNDSDDVSDEQFATSHHSRKTSDLTTVVSHSNNLSEKHTNDTRRRSDDTAPGLLSETVERAFRTLLDEHLLTCQLGRRSAPCQSSRHSPRPSSKSSCHNTSTTKSTAGSSKFSRLHSSLRQHMYHKVDSHSSCAKTDTTKSKIGLLQH